MQAIKNKTKLEILNKIHKRALLNYEVLKREEDSIDANNFLKEINTLSLKK